MRRAYNGAAFSPRSLDSFETSEAITISGNPVMRSGGGFTITTNGTCFTNLTFAITDAAGRTLLTPPTATNAFGTAAPAPAPIVLTPNSLSPSSCAPGAQLGQILGVNADVSEFLDRHPSILCFSG